MYTPYSKWPRYFHLAPPLDRVNIVAPTNHQRLQKGLTLPASISMNSGTRRRATGTTRCWGADASGSSLCITATISSSILSLPPRRGSYNTKIITKKRINRENHKHSKFQIPNHKSNEQHHLVQLHRRGNVWTIIKLKLHGDECRRFIPLQELFFRIHQSFISKRQSTSALYTKPLESFSI